MMAACSRILTSSRLTRAAGILICGEMPGAEARRYAADVKAILDDLAHTSPELLQRIQQHVRYIARAEISNRFEYCVRPRLLLLDVDYRHERGDLRTSIKRDIAEAARLAHLRFQQGS